MVDLNIELSRFKYVYDKNSISMTIYINSIWNIPDVSLLINRENLFIDYINRNRILSRRFYNFYRNYVSKDYELLENNKIRVPLIHFITFINLINDANLMYNIYLKSNAKQLNNEINVNQNKLIKDNLFEYILNIKKKLQNSEYLYLYNLISKIN